MSGPINGSPRPLAQSSGLPAAMEAHREAVKRTATQPNGTYSVDVLSMLCELELYQLKQEVVFEALVDQGILDPVKMVQKLTARLEAETKLLNDAHRQRIVQAVGGVLRPPRNG